MKSVVEKIIQARGEYLKNSTVMSKELLVSMDNLKSIHSYFSEIGLINSDYTRPIDLIDSLLFGMKIVCDAEMDLHIR